MILVIDNYDSFVFNLARYFERLGQRTLVIRNDAISCERVAELAPQAIVISPGPCGPTEAGESLEIVKQLARSIPMLGVCLGHQTMAQAFGGKVIRAARPVHGRSSAIQHTGERLFEKLPQPMNVGRYHSLIVDRHTLPDCFRVTAELTDGTIMAIEHREQPLFGVQFHPESVLTEGGFALLANFLRLAGLACSEPLPEMASELVVPPVRVLPPGPVPH